VIFDSRALLDSVIKFFLDLLALIIANLWLVLFRFITI